MDMLLPMTPLAGRFLIGMYFVFFGFWNIYHWRPLLNTLIQKSIPLPFILLPLGLFWQITAGIMIVFGSSIKIAALSLALFTLVGAFIFHDYWNQKGEHHRLNKNIFITKLTIILGALLILAGNIASQ